MQPDNNLKNVALSFICTEDWDKMHPTATGRHCDVCNKAVVDFTNKTQAEFEQAMLEANGKLCGRFKTRQTIHLPEFRFDKAAAMLMVSAGLTLLSSNLQAQKTVGKIARPQPQLQPVKGNVAVPTLRGEVALPPKDTTKTKPSNWIKTQPGDWKDQILMGDTIGPLPPEPVDTDSTSKAVIIPDVIEDNTLIGEGYIFGPGDTAGLSKVHSIPVPEVYRPTYPGGDVALQNTIGYHLRWPVKLIEDAVVWVELEIDKEGVVYAAVINKGYRADVDSEALRIAKLLVFTPAKKSSDGTPVKSSLLIPINFTRR